MKRPLFVALLLAAMAVPVFAASISSDYVELADAPIITVDWSKGKVQVVTLHGNRTFVFENGERGGKYLLVIKQDAYGTRVPLWPAALHWPGGTPAALTSTAGRTDFLTIFSDGSVYYALGLAQNY